PPAASGYARRRGWPAAPRGRRAWAGSGRAARSPAAGARRALRTGPWRTGSPALRRHRAPPPAGDRCRPARTRSGSVPHRPDCPRSAGCRSGSLPWFRASAGGRRRQFDEEGTALPGPRLGPDAPAMALGHPPRDRETESVAAALVAAMQALERQEQLVSIAHVETASVVGDRQLQAPVADRALDRDPHLVAVGRELPCVVEHFPQQHLDPVLVAARP